MPLDTSCGARPFGVTVLGSDAPWAGLGTEGRSLSNDNSR